MGRQFPYPHSPNPIPHSIFVFFALIAIFASSSTGAAGPDFRVTASQGQVSIRWTSDQANPYKVAVEVYGLSAAAIKRWRQSKPTPAQWRRLFSIYAGQEEPMGASDLPPMAGVYRVESNSLRFEPQFPLEPGLSYRAVFRPDQVPGGSGSAAPLTSVYQSPRRSATPSTLVSRVYPSADTLPENLLKFYVHFTAPMSRGNIYDHIRLRDEGGKDVDLPFLEIDEELWDTTMTRLTLIIDPGRIKRGVRPLEEIGPALEAGKSYTLVIGREWRDGAGNPLKESFQKAFKVAPPDRDPPDPARWMIEAPRADSRDPLAVVFPEPMDHALSQRLIRVAGGQGEMAPGKVSLEDQERRWTFTPDNVWRRGRYQLIIHTTLEDLAGNNIGKPFEVDLFDGVERRLSTTTVKLSFEIR
ncbi:MAG TPA: Ig-like domain-containing protein [Blastocatellia bacterium]|nr:Ig-like domain-containing protein [Blastocatellia bacterium]